MFKMKSIVLKQTPSLQGCGETKLMNESSRSWPKLESHSVYLRITQSHQERGKLLTRRRRRSMIEGKYKETASLKEDNKFEASDSQEGRLWDLFGASSFCSSKRLMWTRARRRPTFRDGLADT